MSLSLGSRTPAEIAPYLCGACRQIPGWYCDMPDEMWIASGLAVETAARGHLKYLWAALSASTGKYERIDGFQRLTPGNGTSSPVGHGPSLRTFCIDGYSLERSSRVCRTTHQEKV